MGVFTAPPRPEPRINLNRDTKPTQARKLRRDTPPPARRRRSSWTPMRLRRPPRRRNLPGAVMRRIERLTQN